VNGLQNQPPLIGYDPLSESYFVNLPSGREI
jgi:hypothetical protein